MKKRILAMIMTLAMCLSLLPTAAFATEGEAADPLTPDDLYYNFDGTPATGDNPDITLHKQAKSLGNGKFEVTLSAEAKSVVIPRHTNVIFVLDASASMNACTENCGHDNQTGVNCYVTRNQQTSPKSRLSIATKAIQDMKNNLGENGISYFYFTFGAQNKSTEQSKIYDNTLTLTNGTYIAEGVTKAVNKVMTENAGTYQFTDKDSKHVMIVVSDGAATDKNYDPEGLDEFIRAGGEVYAVGFTFTNDEFKGIVSAAEPNSDQYAADVEKYYFDASSASELDFAMDAITQNIIGLITDPMGPEVELVVNENDDTTDDVRVEGYDSEATVVGSTINWTNTDGLTSPVTLTYTVDIKPTEKVAGEIKYDLNGDARLNYVYDGVEESVLFPVPTTSFYAATLDVRYELEDNTKVDELPQEWLMLPGSFTTDIPEVGDSYGEYTVKEVAITVDNKSAEIPAKLTATDECAKAYKVVATLVKAPVTATYTVEHYKQNLDETYPTTASESETLTGTTGEKTAAAAKTYEGFTAQSFEQEEISANGDTVVKIYYDRNSYKVTYNYGTAPSGASTLPAEATYKYGAEVTVAADATAPGYTFDGWTSDAPQVGANDSRFIMPAAPVTLVGSFSPRTDIQYTVKYLEEETNNVLHTEKVVTDCTFNAPKSETAVDIDNYVVVGEKTQSFTLDQDNKVITFYYAADSWKDAEETDAEDEDSTTGGDKIPDKYQVLVNYRSEDSNKGTVAPALEVLTIRDANGALASTGNVTAEGSTATAGDAYVFTKWEMTAMPVDYTKVADITKNTTGEIALNNVSGKNEFTFTASFAEKSTTVDVEKVVSKITAPDGTAYESLTSAKVGDTITWTITAENKGNVTQTLTLADELSNAANMTAKDSAGNAVTTITLSPGEKETYTVTYTVAPSDAGDTLINTAILKDGGTKKDEDTSDGVKVENPLEVSKTVDKTSAKVNETITYTITVKNTGNAALSGVEIIDTFTGAGTPTMAEDSNVTFANGKFTINALAVGETETITVKYVAVSDDANKTVTNAVVSDLDKTTGNDSVSTEITRPSGGGSYTPNIPDNPPALNKVDHFAYIIGYPDGNVEPQGNITRAEVATIFFRMLTDESRAEFWSQSNDYSDVTATKWFNNAVSTLSNGGIITGYNDGTFKPNGNITRAEFATMAVRFFSASYEGEDLFPDIDKHWAKAYINTAAYEGIINGYEDGTFRPDQYITRAEAMTIVNRVLDRHPDKDNLLEDMIQWPDNMDTEKWYYADVQEATNSHDYDMEGTEAEPYEVWTEILPVRDWVALEKEWSDSNSAPGGEVMN